MSTCVSNVRHSTRVNETVSRDQWIWWDVGFLALGLVLVLAALLVARTAGTNRALRGSEPRFQMETRSDL
jgi:uncharacterized membrane protein